MSGECEYCSESMCESQCHIGMMRKFEQLCNEISILKIVLESEKVPESEKIGLSAYIFDDIYENLSELNKMIEDL